MKSKLYLLLWVILGMACGDDELDDIKKDTDDDKKEEPVTVDLTDLSLTIAENPKNGAVLGTISGTTSSGAITYSVASQSPDGAFAINTTTGELTVSDSALFDFETRTELTAKIYGTNDQVKDSASVTVTLTDITSVVSAEDFEITMDENGANKDKIGTLVATGDEGPLAYSISSQSHAGAIAIDEGTGILTISDVAQFDYEQNKTLTAVVAVTSGATSTTANVTITLKNVVFEQVTVTGEYFSKRQSHQAVEFKGKLWVIGGSTSNDTYLNDVWSSDDGKSWTKQGNSNNQFSARDGHRVVVFDDKLWVIGGVDDFDVRDDVWSSTDGIAWTEVLSASQPSPVRVASVTFRYPAVYNHEVIVFDNSMWIIGGEDDNGNKVNDMYKSSNGTSWIKQTPLSTARVSSVATVFSARSEHQAVVFDNKIWVIGGEDGGGYTDDIWSSSDGINWSKTTVSGTQFSDRSGHRLAVYDNKMWLIGGRGGSFSTPENDVWYTSDGATWEKEEDIGESHFTARYRHEVVVFDNNLWFIGGYSTGEDGFENDIWTKE